MGVPRPEPAHVGFPSDPQAVDARGTGQTEAVEPLRVGYACVNTQLPSSSRTVRLANATPDRLRALIRSNLDALAAILAWNRANGISTHPGQYTVLSSVRPPVVDAAVAELEYHDRLLSALGLDPSHKIVLHVGSGAGEFAEACSRFAAGFERLSPNVAARLVLENDERWPLESVLALAEPFGLPVVFDVFHHRLARSFEGSGIRELVLRAGQTWRAEDGRQEVHFSTQAVGRRPGAHAEEIDLAEFGSYVDEVGDLPLDCIIEVQDKERSALRAQEFLSARRQGAASVATVEARVRRGPKPLEHMGPTSDELVEGEG